jgi:hypothetical protein
MLRRSLLFHTLLAIEVPTDGRSIGGFAVSVSTLSRCWRADLSVHGLQLEVETCSEDVQYVAAAVSMWTLWTAIFLAVDGKALHDLVPAAQAWLEACMQ